MRRLKRYASTQGWQREQYGEGPFATSLYCLRSSDLPFNEQEDYTVSHQADPLLRLLTLSKRL